MNKYTVLFLKPDYVADTYGQDTFCAYVKASDHKHAIEEARSEACKADEQDNPDDYYCLFCATGYIPNLL